MEDWTMPDQVRGPIILFFLDNHYYYSILITLSFLSFSSFHLLSCHCNFQFDRITVELLCLFTAVILGSHTLGTVNSIREPALSFGNSTFYLSQLDTASTPYRATKSTSQ